MENRETVNKETANKEKANRETANIETANIETTNRETANKETTNIETAKKETANKETADKETSNRADTEQKLLACLGKPVSAASEQEVFAALLKLCGSLAGQNAEADTKKKLYYLSAEFLIGKLLSNNLINLGIYDDVREILEKGGKDLARIEELETEPSLGNGGLGRLAACFLDSAATLGLSADGVGLNYHMGLFRQSFEQDKQKENPDPWISEPGWLIRTGTGYSLSMGGKTYRSVMYDLQVTGYQGRTNRLHLFDLETVSDTIIKNGIDFDKKDIGENLTLFLYPDDSDEDGRKLRVYQEYFLVSNAARLILDECISRGSNLRDLNDYAVIQINDTHPTMVIPELIRLLMEKGLTFDEALETVKKTCAYTNHTILAEALETWPESYLEEIVPQLIPIIEAIDDRVRRKYPDESVAVIDREDRVHMAHIDIHCGFSVNGVAELHTEILKHTELSNFYRIYPEKFNNKTNGITFRRWLLSCNPLLSALIREKIGDGFIKNPEELDRFSAYGKEQAVLQRLAEIKKENKKRLSEYLLTTRGIRINPDSVFDVQAKRLHEYKRQQLNLLWDIAYYLDLKRGRKPENRLTAIFAAKAAPAYTTAKEIIHAILCLRDVVDADQEVRDVFQIAMVENYNVSAAEKLIPACDISEQISLASKEASGTGNMKFMLNGAVTLGTEDGANAEIHRMVGDDNIYIFGMDSEEVIRRYREKDYNPRAYYEADPRLKEAVDFLTGPEMLARGDKEMLTKLKDELLGKDWFMTFPDFDAYGKAKAQALRDYGDTLTWQKKAAVNIAAAGFFSSDRTVREYNRDIWKLPLPSGRVS